MSRKKNKRRNKRKQNKKLLIALCVILAIAIIILTLIIIGSRNDSDKGEDSESDEVALTFPYELENGKLEVNSLFQFSGSNPDCKDEEGENIAALTIINKSEKHLVSAEIKVRISNGMKLSFEISDLPAGQSIMAFEKNNTSYEFSDECESIDCNAKFEDESVLMEDAVSIKVDETDVTVTNISDKELSDLILHCHCLIDNDYFGGLTYIYPVEKISAGESATFQAEECYLGEASVVRVSQDAEAK